MNDNDVQNFKYALKKLPAVESVGEVEIKDRIIERISFENITIGRLLVSRIDVEDASTLFDFYFHGLSEESRKFFPPYPLFSPPVNSAEDLANRIINWKEEDDWTFLKLTKDQQIIGVALLKRYKTEQPRSGLAVREEFHNEGLGFLLQTIVTEQARLLKLKNLYAAVAPDNIASLKVHKKCGLKETGRLVPHFVYKENGTEEVDRHDVEFIIEFNDG